MENRPPPIPLAIKRMWLRCATSGPANSPSPTGGAVLVMGITAHSAVYCFGLTAPPGATVRIMCLSSMNLGPLNWRPSFFGVACPHSLGAVGGPKSSKT